MRKLLVSLVVAVSVGAVAPYAAAAPDPGATSAVASAVQARLGSPTELYANCPTENVIVDINGVSGLECEFRAVVANFVQVGTATAVPSGGGWVAENLFFSRPAPNEWRKCGRQAAGGRSLSPTGDTRSIQVHGVTCRFLALDLWDVRRNVSRKHLLIRPHFTIGGRGTNTIGFVIFAMSCDGKNLARHEGSRLFAAQCSNPFGDAIDYRFKMAGLSPPHHHGGGGSGGGGGGGGGGSNCTPGYSPCIPPGPDVDCAGGGGDGPRFVQGPIKVTGSDPYGLDSDGNGIGCE